MNGLWELVNDRGIETGAVEGAADLVQSALDRGGNVAERVTQIRIVGEPRERLGRYGHLVVLPQGEDLSADDHVERLRHLAAVRNVDASQSRAPFHAEHGVILGVAA